jgi:ubiquinone/menaquinone biosynthesis C-methylase UbiE
MSSSACEKTLKPTERFTSHAGAYARARPSYPSAAIDALLDGLGAPASLKAADLGAGTGISSRLIAARGVRVIAVEPNAAMREQAEPAANVAWVAGTAEHTTLESASVDLVTAFQAFHWFDYEAALREMARICRPGGRLALVYNERDESDPFTGDYGAIVRRYATDKTEKRRADGRSSFEGGPWRSRAVLHFANTHALDRAGLHARARSTSYLPKDGDEALELHAALDALFDRHARTRMVHMQMKTIVSLGNR